MLWTCVGEYICLLLLKMCVELDKHAEIANIMGISLHRASLPYVLPGPRWILSRTASIWHAQKYVQRICQVNAIGSGKFSEYIFRFLCVTPFTPTVFADY